MLQVSNIHPNVEQKMSWEQADAQAGSRYLVWWPVSCISSQTLLSGIACESSWLVCLCSSSLIIKSKCTFEMFFKKLGLFIRLWIHCPCYLDLFAFAGLFTWFWLFFDYPASHISAIGACICTLPILDRFVQKQHVACDKHNLLLTSVQQVFSICRLILFSWQASYSAWGLTWGKS